MIIKILTVPDEFKLNDLTSELGRSGHSSCEYASVFIVRATHFSLFRLIWQNDTRPLWLDQVGGPSTRLF